MSQVGGPFIALCSVSTELVPRIYDHQSDYGFLVYSVVVVTMVIYSIIISYVWKMTDLRPRGNRSLVVYSFPLSL